MRSSKRCIFSSSAAYLARPHSACHPAAFMVAFSATVALTCVINSANAGVIFNSHLVSSSGGIDRWEIDVVGLTGADLGGDGLTSLTGTFVATFGSFVLPGSTLGGRRTNFSSNGPGLGGGSTWINLDSFASNPVSTPNTNSPTSISGWAMFTTDTSSQLKPSNALTAAGFPRYVVGEVYITNGGRWSLSGNYNTAATNNAPMTFGIPEHGFNISLSAQGPADNGTVIVNSAGPGQYAGQILKFAAPTSYGQVAINDIGNQGDPLSPTTIILWVSGADSPAMLENAVSYSSPGLTSVVASTDPTLSADDAALFANYGPLGTASGVGGASSMVILHFVNPGSLGNYNDFINFSLPFGDNVTAITAVPEPASLAFLAASGLALLKRRVRL